MDNYVQIDDRNLESLKNELMPGGRWFFPVDLEAQLARRIGLEFRQPVRGNSPESIMNNWEDHVLRLLAGEISAAYRDDRAVTDYVKLWPAYTRVRLHGLRQEA